MLLAQGTGMSRTEVPLNFDLISVDVWRDVLTLLDLLDQSDSVILSPALYPCSGPLKSSLAL